VEPQAANNGTHNLSNDASCQHTDKDRKNQKPETVFAHKLLSFENLQKSGVDEKEIIKDENQQLHDW
jgi:hypothetical protein